MMRPIVHEQREAIEAALSKHVVHGYMCRCGSEVNDAARHVADAVLDALGLSAATGRGRKW